MNNQQNADVQSLLESASGLLKKTDQLADHFLAKARNPEIKKTWTSLEVAKLLVPALIGAVLSWEIQSVKMQADQIAAGEKAAASERAQKAHDDEVRRDEENRRLQEAARQRVQLWSKVAIDINTIYCFIQYVGVWKETRSDEVIAAKRRVDQVIFGNQMFFTDEFLRAFSAFEAAAFKPFVGFGADAQIRTWSRGRIIDAPAKGQVGSPVPSRFTEEREPAIQETYQKLLQCGGRDMNVVFSATVPSGREPPGIEAYVKEFEMKMDQSQRVMPPLQAGEWLVKLDIGPEGLVFPVTVTNSADPDFQPASGALTLGQTLLVRMPHPGRLDIEVGYPKGANPPVRARITVLGK